MKSSNSIKWIKPALVLAMVLLPALPSFGQTSQSIQGTVNVAPALAKKASPTGVLFVIAREKGAQGGPPAAVVRIAGPKFPQAFELDAQNLMMGGEFKGPYDLTAKLSFSGNAMTTPGDLLSGAQGKKSYSAGAKNVKLVLDQEAR